MGGTVVDAAVASVVGDIAPWEGEDPVSGVAVVVASSWAVVSATNESVVELAIWPVVSVTRNADSASPVSGCEPIFPNASLEIGGSPAIESTRWEPSSVEGENNHKAASTTHAPSANSVSYTHLTLPTTPYV